LTGAPLFRIFNPPKSEFLSLTEPKRIAMTVIAEKRGPVTTIIINRPEVKNAVDRPTAQALADSFRAFDGDGEARVGVLWGAGGCFCAGADLKAISGGLANRMEEDGDGPMGPTRMFLSKPVIAAVAGYAVAGGLELALLCDLRVMEKDAFFGVFCRRWGVPLIDGGTVRLPRLIGLSNALDMILTGRPVGAEEALRMGLVNRVVEPGTSRAEAEALAETISNFPQNCLRSDRRSAYEQSGLPFDAAMRNEFRIGLKTILTGETVEGATRFAKGAGRHGQF
jgi:enoyl-CoA hydratase